MNPRQTLVLLLTTLRGNQVSPGRGRRSKYIACAFAPYASVPPCKEGDVAGRVGEVGDYWRR
jgi:hypothetical protein